MFSFTDSAAFCFYSVSAPLSWSSLKLCECLRQSRKWGKWCTILTISGCNPVWLNPCLIVDTRLYFILLQKPIIVSRVRWDSPGQRFLGDIQKHQWEAANPEGQKPLILQETLCLWTKVVWLCLFVLQNQWVLTDLGAQRDTKAEQKQNKQFFYDIATDVFGS